VGGVDRGVPDGEAVVLDVSQLQGAAEANALAAKGIAIERGVESEQIAGSEALALHAAGYNGMPDPVFISLSERSGS
jgi:hypothetical protein